MIKTQMILMVVHKLALLRLDGIVTILRIPQHVYQYVEMETTYLAKFATMEEMTLLKLVNQIAQGLFWVGPVQEEVLMLREYASKPVEIVLKPQGNNVKMQIQSLETDAQIHAKLKMAGLVP